MRVRQVHRLAVRAEAEAVGHDETVELRFDHTRLPGAVAVEPAFGRTQAHVQHHAAGPETALAVAATIVEAHVCSAVLDGGEQFAVEPAIAVRVQMKKAALHPGNPAATAVTGDAGEHLRGFPGMHMAGVSAPALQSAVGNIDPIQRVFLRHPDRAFAHGVASIDD